jgi:hypothetical protein
MLKGELHVPLFNCSKVKITADAARVGGVSGLPAETDFVCGRRVGRKAT